MKLRYQAWHTWYEEHMDLLGEFDTPEEAIEAALADQKVTGEADINYEVEVVGWKVD